MTGTITTATLDVRGATLYYEVRGQDPFVERRRPDGRRLVRPVSYAVRERCSVSPVRASTTW
ncbi:hypothetical protein HCN51_16240 [Nonomuraea sp. FMUSA5-5]|uniref:Uncharacterized protein n=1 Tax=Nonomuraea composti TaxID=2720023 RepID=A0ABX1B7S8_9ACTN|nr:hypothetical protein [Nonomuraea sp. FMUSA5-5]NJP90988.1 hypothetical protein [Nonomuraea sp. FMUSA5-5]